MPGAVPPLASGWQQWAGRPNRRLPLSDYNLWSISIIGGVCRDSNSNNYLDWSVSKATNIPTTLPKWREGCGCGCVCVCALLGGVKSGRHGTLLLRLALLISAHKYVQTVGLIFLISFGLAVLSNIPSYMRPHINNWTLVKVFSSNLLENSDLFVFWSLCYNITRHWLSKFKRHTFLSKSPYLFKDLIIFSK